MAERKLTVKQQRFADAYDGNATAAAVKAGYSQKTATEQGARLLANVKVSAAIRAREWTESRRLVSDRIARQEFWSRIMLDESQEMRDRLRASELLGKSEGDFWDRMAATVDGEVIIRWGG